MIIEFMTQINKDRLIVDPIGKLEKRVKRLENNIITTAKAYRQIGMIQVAKDIEVLIN